MTAETAVIVTVGPCRTEFRSQGEVLDAVATRFAAAVAAVNWPIKGFVPWAAAGERVKTAGAAGRHRRHVSGRDGRGAGPILCRRDRRDCCRRDCLTAPHHAAPAGGAGAGPGQHPRSPTPNSILLQPSAGAGTAAPRTSARPRRCFRARMWLCESFRSVVVDFRYDLVCERKSMRCITAQ